MEKIIIQTDHAPAPIGPYSQAVRAGNMLFVSGQIALNPISGELVMEDIHIETRQVMMNLHAILHAAGAGFENVVQTSIFLSDFGYFGAVNEVYGSYFEGNYPSRATVAVKTLPKNVNVEIAVTAVI
jgi:2-iminobutanoate/2-iminopropanoate deaminase